LQELDMTTLDPVWETIYFWPTDCRFSSNSYILKVLITKFC